MARPFSGKVHVGENRITRKNGITYVYERTTQYDRQSKKTMTTSTRLIGKILPGETEMVSTRHRKPNGYRKAAGSASRKHVGLTDILEWAGRESHIDHDLQVCFSAGDCAKIQSIARYWLGTDGNTLPRLEGWQLMHDLPYPYGISEDVYGELFKSLGRDESGIQGFFMARAGRLSIRPVIAYDSTTISTYSQNQHEARRGFNKEKDGLDTIKLLTLYSVKDEEPIAYSKQPGNIPDVICIDNAIMQFKCLGIDKPLVTTDTGYCSEQNLCELCRRNMKFLTLIDTDIRMAREAVDTLRGQLASMGAVCPFDYHVSGAATTIMHEFSFKRERTRNGIAAGETVRFTRRLHLYAFKSNDLWEQHEIAFRRKLLELKQQIEQGVSDFTEAAKERIRKYLVCTRTGRGGRLHVSFNEEACAEARKYFGHFTLISNTPLGVFEALEYYRMRERIEELFQSEKENVDGRRPRLWYPDALRGRMFVQFVALCYRCFIVKKIKTVKAMLGEDDGKKTARQLELERKLLNWLNQRSLAQIFDWFDCLEETTVKTDVGVRRWSAESVARDRLFLELLGVSKS